jgi:hypothetical protein
MKMSYKKMAYRRQGKGSLVTRCQQAYGRQHKERPLAANGDRRVVGQEATRKHAGVIQVRQVTAHVADCFKARGWTKSLPSTKAALSKGLYAQPCPSGND